MLLSHYFLQIYYFYPLSLCFYLLLPFLLCFHFDVWMYLIVEPLCKPRLSCVATPDVYYLMTEDVGIVKRREEKLMYGHMQSY